jgi:hypothetical protein
MQTRELTSTKSKSTAAGLLWQYGIRLDDIAGRTGYSKTTIFTALSLRDCGGVTYRTLVEIRMDSEALLREAGYAGELAGIWDEYELALRQSRVAA